MFVLYLIPKDKEVLVKDNSVLKIEFKGIILDRTSGKPFDNIGLLNFSPEESIELKDILDNTSIDSTESAWNMKEKSQYKLKLIEQIYISDNREKFLNIEIDRAKKNLGKLIKEKDLVDEKIKIITQLENNDREKKFINSMPPPKNN